MKIYIAGPMSGYPGFNIPAFDSAAEYLRKEGFEVVSPAEVDGTTTRAALLKSPDGNHDDLPKDESWSFYLARDFRILADEGIEAIVCLPGWQQSKGARLEVAVGKELGIPQFDIEEYDPIIGFPGEVERAYHRSANPEMYDAEGRFIRHDDNPLRQRQVTGGVKDNRGKSRVDLIPSAPLVGVGHVLAFGAQKYKPHNWRLGLRWSDTLGSIWRHLLAFADGEDIDPETGLPHIDQALCQNLFLSEYYHKGTGIDDRWSSLDEAAREEAKA